MTFETHTVSTEEIKEEFGLTILPCPYCGGERILTCIENINYETGYAETWSFRLDCVNCKLNTQEIGEDDAQTELEAYNRRAPSPRVQITDQEALEKITPEQLRAYLTSKRYQFDSTYQEHGEVWKSGHAWDIGRKEIIVSFKRTLPNYAMCIKEAVYLLGETENRSQLDIYYDIVGGGG